MLALVTRPQPQAEQWAQALQALGQPAQALPLIDIGAPAQPQVVAQAWARLAQIKLVMFVSPNAATWFARLRPAGATWPANTLAAAPGPGTAQALLAALAEAGLRTEAVLTPPQDSEQFDSEHLWPLLAPLPWLGQQVLIISGGDQSSSRGRQWLSEQWQAQGAEVRSLLTYQRQAPQWQPPQHALAHRAYQAPHEHLWVFSSSEAVSHLLGVCGPPPAGAHALATHPKVAESARQAGFEDTMVCRPTLAAVAQAAMSHTCAVAQVPRRTTLASSAGD